MFFKLFHTKDFIAVLSRSGKAVLLLFLSLLLLLLFFKQKQKFILCVILSNYAQPQVSSEVRRRPQSTGSRYSGPLQSPGALKSSRTHAHTQVLPPTGPYRYDSARDRLVFSYPRMSLVQRSISATLSYLDVWPSSHPGSNLFSLIQKTVCSLSTFKSILESCSL